MLCVDVLSPRLDHVELMLFVHVTEVLCRIRLRVETETLRVSKVVDDGGRNRVPHRVSLAQAIWHGK
jgi:hypothetical protein